ncbi:LmeA family phospholipid-binding protein [Leifsonia sp. NPDC058292]|uniref:LmeA family phospholipid-binding protein n=1 Tax=Leifsonia sp. NPDC058292 TaxID=3346428 RepID=UPI0036DE288C
MSDSRPNRTAPTEVVTPAAPLAQTAPPRKKRRGLRVLLWILIPILVLVALFFVVDAIVRSYAEGRVASEIEKNLPDTVDGDIAVHIGGVSVIQQYLSGSFERVELEAPKLTVQNVPISASVVATGVPSDFTKPVAAIDGTLGISQSALNRLVTIPGVTGDLRLGTGTLGYAGTADLLGLPIGYQLSVKPEAAGKTVLLQPVDATVTTGAGDLDLSTLVKALTDRGPLPVCVAQYLPNGVLVNDITVTKGHATVDLNANDLVLDEATLRSKGSC